MRDEGGNFISHDCARFKGLDERNMGIVLDFLWVARFPKYHFPIPPLPLAVVQLTEVRNVAAASTEQNRTEPMDTVASTLPLHFLSAVRSTCWSMDDNLPFKCRKLCHFPIKFCVWGWLGGPIDQERQPDKHFYSHLMTQKILVCTAAPIAHNLQTFIGKNVATSCIFFAGSCLR